MPQPRRKIDTIRARLLEMLEQSSPMLHHRLITGRVTEEWALKLYAGSRLRLYRKETNVEQVAMFKCSDGEMFDTEPEAAEHERALKAEAEIDQFIAAQDFKRGQGTHAKNVLMSFVAWKADGAG